MIETTNRNVLVESESLIVRRIGVIGVVVTRSSATISRTNSPSLRPVQVQDLNNPKKCSDLIRNRWF